MKQKISGDHPYAIDVDLSNCDNEPIHFIPYIQHHACLIACEPASLRIIHISENLIEKIGFHYAEVLHKPLESVLPPSVFNIIQQALSCQRDLKEINPLQVQYEVEGIKLKYNLLVHQHDQKLILEFEPINSSITSTGYQYKLSRSIYKIQQAKCLSGAYENSAREIRKLTGFDRVMVYRFDKEGNGQVIAENKREDLEPFLGLHYPASDIPKQARALFLINKVRVMSDVEGKNSLVHPPLDTENKPLDLTFAATRGVSPIHLEYLRNMGVVATMSIAIENEGKLWGMFACHHYAPKITDYDLRVSCELLGQVLSGQLSLHAVNHYRNSILEVNIKKSQLFEQMSIDWNIIEGLMHQKLTIMDLFDCTGACILSEDELVMLGKTPSEEQIRELASWLDHHTKAAYFQTNALGRIYKQASAFMDTASGLLAVRISPEASNYILWFRPEILQEVSWAGNPNKKEEDIESTKRISPRKSFAKWTQLVHGKSLPWQSFEWEAALGLRNDIKDFIHKKYKEIKQLNTDLTKAYQELESFSYSVSHDLRAPLRNIRGFAQILIEDYSGQLDSYGKEVIETILSSSSRMNNLIDDILAFSKIGRTNIIINELKLQDHAQAIFEELVMLDSVKNKNNTQLIITNPELLVYADAILFKQLLHNLISNAVKYSAGADQPKIEIGGEKKKDRVVFYVKDNGIGIDIKHKKKVFNVFTRLVNEEKYPGNGVGLSIVKRIVEQHDGSIDLQSEVNKGATFLVSLPIPTKD